MQKYRRLAYVDRCQIHALLQANFSVVQIAKKLGFNKSTIYREVKRNSVSAAYDAEKASVRSKKRFYRCRRKKIINYEISQHILAYASFGWSPEQISGRLASEKKLKISRQTIYRNFAPKTFGYKMIRRRFGKRGFGRSLQRRRNKDSRISIHSRPKVANERRRLGDWERDGMYGANRQQLLVLTDRKSRYTKIAKMGTGNSKDVARITKGILSTLGKKVFTITNDNGSEFSDTNGLPWKVFFSEPYKPHQRGSVENAIGLLRQYIKRSTDLNEFSNKDLQVVENAINFRPRKCLDYQTPFEVFFKKKVALAMDI